MLPFCSDKAWPAYACDLHLIGRVTTSIELTRAKMSNLNFCGTDGKVAKEFQLVSDLNK